MVAGGAEAGHLRAARRRVRRDARPVDAERRSRGARRARSTRAATGSSSARGPASSILEALEHAEARGATILAELVGYGATADASHITLPAPGGIGAVRAARRALEKAGLDARRHRPRQRPRDLDARGRQGRAPGDEDDPRRATPAASRSRPTSRCSATRSARPGAIEAIARSMTIRDGCVPPTINLVDPDPEAEGLDLTPNVAARQRRSAIGAQQLVRVRRPEHGPDLPAVGRMTDDDQTPATADPAEATEPRRGARAARRSAATTATSSCSRLIDRLAGPARRSDLDRARGRGRRDRARPAQAVARSRRPSPAPPPRRRRRRRRPTRSRARRAGRPPVATRRRPRQAVGQGAADRHLLRLAGARAPRRTSRSAARSRSARSSASSRR